MVFRTIITHTDGTTETLQVCSQPIVCSELIDILFEYLEKQLETLIKMEKKK